MAVLDERFVLFDLDGTLTDPFPGITQSIAFALKRLGRPAPELGDLKWCIGPPLAGSLRRLLDTEDETLVEKAVEHYRERFSTVGLYENAVYEGIPEAVAALKALGARTFVATSKPGIFAQKIVDHFDLSELFDAVYGSELDGTRSNKGELIAHLLAREGLSPQLGVMIGDREHDVIGAARCNVVSLGVLYGYGSQEELVLAGARDTCQSPGDIPDAVTRLFGPSRTGPSQSRT